jgi:hypothetical protein
MKTWDIPSLLRLPLAYLKQAVSISSTVTGIALSAWISLRVS